MYLYIAMLKILQDLSKEYDSKLGYKKSDISINKFPINLNDIKEQQTPNLLYGYSRKSDRNLFSSCIYNYFKNIYKKIKIIDPLEFCEEKDTNYDLIIDLFSSNQSKISKYECKNYVKIYNPEETYGCGNVELIFFPFGNLMGYPIIHVTDSHLEKLIKFNNITNAVNVYNLIYRESEQENEHCFDCYYAKQLGVTNVKHTEGNLDDYIRSLIILPLIEMDKTVNDIDLDLDQCLSEYCSPPIKSSQFEDTIQLTKEAPFVPISDLQKYSKVKFNYKLPYTFTIVDLSAEMVLIRKFFSLPDYYINDLSHSTASPIDTIIKSGKSKYCVKIRPHSDFKFSSKAKLFLAPYACNIDCHDINVTGDTADLKDPDITISLQDVINFKMYYNFIERNLRHWYLEDNETETCCYDCIFAQFIDPSFKTKKIGIHHNLMKQYLPIQRLKVLYSLQ